MLLRWDGRAVKVCSYSAGPSAALLGALADRLILLRGGAGGHAAVTCRAASLLPALLQAWSSLSASGLLPGEGGRCLLCNLSPSCIPATCCHRATGPPQAFMAFDALSAPRIPRA